MERSSYGKSNAFSRILMNVSYKFVKYGGAKNCLVEVRFTPKQNEFMGQALRDEISGGEVFLDSSRWRFGLVSPSPSPWTFPPPAEVVAVVASVACGPAAAAVFAPSLLLYLSKRAAFHWRFFVGVGGGVSCYPDRACRLDSFDLAPQDLRVRDQGRDISSCKRATCL